VRIAPDFFRKGHFLITKGTKMDFRIKIPAKLEGGSETLLIPVWARAVETKRPDAIVRDPKALEIFESLEFDFSKFSGAWMTQTGIAVRTRLLDDAAKSFIHRHPFATIVNLGAGLDSRFERLDNGRIRWYEVDLPEVIELRRQFFEETDRYRFIACSITDFSWMDEIHITDCPALLIAEGLLMYFDECVVRSLFEKLLVRFVGSEMLFEMLSPLGVGMGKYNHCISKLKSRKIEFKWSLRHSKELEAWHHKIKFLNEWNVMDHFQHRWGWMMFVMPFFLGMLGNRIVHLRFEQ
jgi:methyltransferase (TIGR00027 family)